MKLENKNGLRVLYPENGYKLFSQKNNSYHDKVYLGINSNPEDYVEISEYDIEGYEPKREVDKINKKLKLMEEENVNMLSTTFELDFRVFELECFLEDSVLFTNKLERGKRTMALSQYEIAKKLILLGEYDRTSMEYKINRYKTRGVISQEQYDELVALMDANEMLEI